MTKFYDAFISYGRADSKAFAEKLQARLSEQGLRIWFDFNDIPLAVDFQNQIDDGIEKAHHFLFVISPHAVNSSYCHQEIERAVALNKRIIPLLHVMEISQETWQQRNPNSTAEDWQAANAQGLHESYQNMHPTIRQINWVYFQEDKDDFEQSLTDLTALLRSHHDDYIKQHTRFLVKALEWKRQQKRTRYLLVGEEKQQAETWLKIRFKDEQPPCLPTDLHCEFITESIKNANNLMTQVFLSYAHGDKTVMEKIRNSLRREGITVWTNTTDIQTGEAFDAAIERGIEQANNVVYLLSPDAVNSTYCQRELALAVSLHKRIIPILVREMGSMQVPSVLQDLQYIDLTDNIKEEDYRLDESQLLKTLLQDAAYYKEHKILLTKALKWQRQQHNPSILLRGYNLRSAETWLRLAQRRRQHPPTGLQEAFIAASLQQPPLESLEVFISYSRSDSDFARKLNDRLQLQGKTTWFDQESIASGTDFQQEIYQGIKTCDNFLFILSPRSVNSPYCTDEVEYAASLNKRFITVLHRPVNPGDLHAELARVQWIDFNPQQRDFDANFSQLVRTIHTDREHVRSHSKWLQRALEWERQDKSADLLLRGNTFSIAQNWLQETEQEGKKPAATALQQAFIKASQNAIEAAAAAEKHRQAEMLHLQEERTQEAEARLAEQKESAKRQKFLLAAVSTLLVAAIGVSAVAFSEWRRAAQVTEGQIKALGRFSLVLAQSDRKFDALLEGIRARSLLNNVAHGKPELEEPIVTALQLAVYGKGFREQNRLGHDDGVKSIAFSPDGQTIASASTDRTVKLWNLRGELLQTLKGHTNGVMSVAFDPDGQTLVSASRDKTVRLWNLQGELLQTFKGHQAWVNQVAFSPDGRTIASASNDGTVKLWSRQGKLLRNLVGHDARVNSIAFSPDGQMIASASADRTVLWNLQGELLQTLEGHDKEVTSVAFAPQYAGRSADNQIVATGSKDGTVKLWNLQGELLQILKEHQDEVNSIAFALQRKGHSSDDPILASGSQDGTVKLWTLRGELLQTLKGHQDGVNSVVFAPQYTGSGPHVQIFASASNDRSVKLWKRPGQQLQILRGQQSQVKSVAFSPDGQILASTSADTATFKFWNLESQRLYTSEGHQAPIASIAFSSDSQTLASGNDNGTVTFWNRQGLALQTFDWHKSAVTSVAFAPQDNGNGANDQTLASGSKHGTIKLWNRESQMPQTIGKHEDKVNSVAFSPDGQILASASADSTVKLWSRQGELLKTLDKHRNGVKSVIFSPDGQILASASADNRVKLWTRQGQALRTLKGHQNGVNSIAFSPDGQMLASASIDKTVKLWTLRGELLQTLRGHQASVISIAFVSQRDGSRSDGQTLVSVSSNSTVILWDLADLTLDSLMQKACAWVGNYLRYNAPYEDRGLCKDYRVVRN